MTEMHICQDGAETGVVPCAKAPRSRAAREQGRIDDGPDRINLIVVHCVIAE